MKQNHNQEVAMFTAFRPCKTEISRPQLRPTRFGPNGTEKNHSWRMFSQGGEENYIYLVDDVDMMMSNNIVHTKTPKCLEVL